MSDEHDPATCPICQQRIEQIEPYDSKLAQEIREGRVIVPHGQAVSRTTYAALYAAINKQQSEAFTIPDMRDRG